MIRDVTYYKARLDAIEQMIVQESDSGSGDGNNFRVLLRNGIIPEELEGKYNKALTEHHQAWLRSGNNQELSFSDLTRFNTWFELHPEKVAGEEKITTSREFPISIKGSKDTIIETINQTLKSATKTNKYQRIRTIKLQAHKKLKTLLKL